MRATEFIVEAETYQPPALSVGDKILKGKFKNSPAEIKGFTKDKHNQPVLKTNKGEVQLFKPRISKLMPESPELEEGWKDWAAGATLGAAALGAQAATHKPVQMWTEPAPSHTQKAPAAKALPALKATKAAPITTKIAAAPKGNVEKIIHTILRPEAKALISAGRAAGMKGAELAQFVAQCAHESANFTQMKEFGGRLDFKKYDPAHNPRKAKILGNKLAGDGAKYHGRGYIQLTGRDNYKRAGHALGLPLEQQPDLVERPDIAAKVAVWFWQNQVAPKVNNFNDTTQVTKPINSGLNGLEDRNSKFAAIMQLMTKV